MQVLFDRFRSSLRDLDEDFTIWHESDIVNEKIIVLRTKELARYKQPRNWRKADIRKLMEGNECVLGGSTDMNEDEEARPSFHVQEKCWGLVVTRWNHCPRCRPECGCHP